MNYSKQYRLSIIASHPVQYHSPLYKEISKLDQIDTTVLYLDRAGLDLVKDKSFNSNIKWDIPLLDGYKFKFLKNITYNNTGGFLSRVNPGLFVQILSNKCDVVMIQGYNNISSWLALLLAKIAKKKIIWRGEAILRGNESNGKYKIKLKKWLLYHFFKLCDVLMYTCTGNKEYLDFYSPPNKKMFPLPCAVDNNFFKDGKKNYRFYKSQLKYELGISESDLVVIFSARFSEWKRPFDLLEAIKLIDHQNIVLLFVGDGPERIKMENFVKINNIKAVFVGFVGQRDILKYYAISDLAVVISSYDPSPKALNEVMNYGIPVIVTKIIGTAKDLVVDQENGFIVNVGDKEAIANSINLINNNRYLIDKMGKKSLDIINEWTFEKDAKGIRDAINFLMS